MPEVSLLEQEEDVVKEASELIADGQPVEWEALFQRAGTPEQRAQLDGLRLLEDIARLALASDDEGATPVDAPSDVDADDEVRSDGSFGTWGKYRLRDRVGEGSFGSVYRGVDPQLDLEVAIKILHERVRDVRLKEQLLAEGRMLAKVKHQNVVSVFGVEFEGDQAGLCTEFVRGETLEDELKANGPMMPRRAVAVAEDVCRALAAVHAAGFVHRDVKARNVMREQSGRIVLMDFGTGRSARQLAAGRFDNTGTPLYMAPEVLVLGQPASECSDVYSVGVLLYHLVTNRYPAEGSTLDELKAAHRERRYRSVTDYQPDLSRAFLRVVQRAIAPNPRDRFAGADAFLAALGQVFPNERPIKVIARRLLQSVFASIVAVSVLTALGWLSSAAFNKALERRPFVSETLWDWMIVGVRSSVLPVFYLVVTFLAIGCCLVVRRLAIGLSSTVRRGDDRVRSRLRIVWRRVGLDDASALASWVVLASSGCLVWACWYFWPFIVAIASSISTAPVELLAALSPGSQPTHDLYRKIFSGLIVATVAAWYVARRFSADRGQALNPFLVAAGVGTLALLLAFSVLPYRLVHSDNEFRAAVWKGARCYIIGERADDVLLFCPALPSPRTQVLSRTTGALERLELRENIFTSFSSAVEASPEIH